MTCTPGCFQHTSYFEGNNACSKTQIEARVIARRHCEANEPAMLKKGYTYILTNKNHTVLYTGVTSNLPKRMEEHRTGKYKSSFSHRYNVVLLVYIEEYNSIVDAIAREKQIKAGSRQKKLDLINGINPEWKDLSLELV
jgi:putative endonuclease